MANGGAARLIKKATIILVFALSPLYAVAATSEELAAALTAAPPQIRALRCADLAAGSGDTMPGSIRQWFDAMIAPVADSGVSTDRIYAQLLLECGQEPGRMVLDVVSELRGVLQGLDHPNR